MASILRPHFSIPKPRLKRWKKRSPSQTRFNLILRLLTGNRGTLRGLAQRTGLHESNLNNALAGKLARMTAVTARKIARGLGVSTDTFLDVLEAYTGWPNLQGKPKSDQPTVGND